MKNLHLCDCNEIRAFLKVNHAVEFDFQGKEDAYDFIYTTLWETGYWKKSKKDKGVIRRYLALLTGYKPSMLTTLIKKARAGKLTPTRYKRNSFPRTYTDEDILLLARTDKLHGFLNAHATREILKRECRVFGNRQYERLSEISPGHIYNLRKTSLYGTARGATFTKTKPSRVPIGERRKPAPCGKPGYIRVDTVHQGDKDGEKGAYHINSIDEVTQFEIVGSVERIAYKFLLPLLKEMINAYPFVIKEFHADNGSEYINYQVANMLNRLLIKLTKSRSRNTNDNALVEGKNGAIVRKHMGYLYIPALKAPLINEFYMKHLNPYLNYHRPCGFVTDTTVTKHGKQKKKYGQYMTPYEKLKSLKDAEHYLKKGVSFDSLDEIAYAMSDNEAARKMQEAKQKLFDGLWK